MTPPRAEPPIHRLDLTDDDTLRGLWELQRAAYAVEADLIGFDGIPPLHETLDDLRACGETFLGTEDLTGAVSWLRPDDGTLDICRLVVHPRAHRTGVARALLDALDRREPAETTTVSTGTANLPAMTLYRRRGFVPTGLRDLAPGVTLTLLTRRTPRTAPQ
ncbi:GNAT family N-acetyltransferase [Umezawaea endophytica]|uniref:GNAT family N-acetyltransferase n=1 Tax=Umezawaea endophytica TaxID=1654476 RepID=A0A9X2VNY0_9PSEU|nr:GNAT family N-acetyltransferase [Umezawaea endophytica]MCS7479604.1 GNAT family N-acetyltransferase [Umezawaea endophytica]